MSSFEDSGDGKPQKKILTPQKFEENENSPDCIENFNL